MVRESEAVASGAEVRFQFGENWRGFLDRLDEERIAEAELSLRTLLGVERLDGKSFLDIGSGSGLFSLAARRLGADVHSFDYDAQSVACTQTLRQRFFPEDARWRVERGSVLDPAFLESLGTFDIVYSWGVLHHTGAMMRAIELAASRVKPGGFFAVALYRKPRLCWAWTIEKRWYARASESAQRFARTCYERAMHAAMAMSGQDFNAYVAGYRSNRGMDFHHNVHDWMGGYPYESITPGEVADVMKRLGFDHVRSNVRPYAIGLFGSGCDEYVYRRTAP